MIHILQIKILIVCLFILNCVVLIILPLSHAPLASPLNFVFKILGGGRAPHQNRSGGAPPPCPPPGYASEYMYPEYASVVLYKPSLTKFILYERRYIPHPSLIKIHLMTPSHSQVRKEQ